VEQHRRRPPIGKVTGTIADAVKALDAAARTGIGFEDAWKGLRALNVSDEVIAGIGAKALKGLREACTKSGLKTLAAAVAPRCWVELGGPGVWAVTNEGGKSARALAYEEQITGVPNGFGYMIENTPNAMGRLKFDGFKNGSLLEAKGPGYSQIMQFRPKLVEDDFVNQAQKQVAAAPNTPIVWHVAEEDVFLKTRAVFAANDQLARIKVVYTPPTG
jgi:hypothetical protein